MADSEEGYLRAEIQYLQNLINSHKSTVSSAPVATHSSTSRSCVGTDVRAVKVTKLKNAALRTDNRIRSNADNKSDVPGRMKSLKHWKNTPQSVSSVKAAVTSSGAGNEGVAQSTKKRRMVMMSSQGATKRRIDQISTAASSAVVDVTANKRKVLPLSPLLTASPSITTAQLTRAQVAPHFPNVTTVASKFPSPSAGSSNLSTVISPARTSVVNLMACNVNKYYIDKTPVVPNRRNHKTKTTIKRKSTQYRWSKGEAASDGLSTASSPNSFPTTNQFKLVRNSPAKHSVVTNAVKLSPLVATTTTKHRSSVSTKYRLVRAPVRRAGSTSSSRYKIVKPSLTSRSRCVKVKRSAGHMAGHKSRYSLKRSSSQQGSTSEMDVNQLLGRSVKNLSRNKYKFISGASSAGRRKTAHSTVLPSRSSLKCDHRRKTPTKGRWTTTRSGHLVVIGGHVYRSSKNKLTLSTSAAHHRTTQHRWSARKVSTSRIPVSTIWRSNSYLKNPALLASRAVVHRSIMTKLRRHSNTSSPKRTRYCMFYNRFGKCNRGDACAFLHDPDKVAVCTRYLRGTCRVEKCPFSHAVSAAKMPVCRYFLRGLCNADNCAYRHVNVSSDAVVCTDFLRGFCQLGDSCKKKHTLVCPEHEKTGACPRGKGCHLRHVTKTRRLKRAPAALCTSTPRQAHEEAPSIIDDVNLALGDRILPSFIALDSTNEMQDSLPVGTPLRIQPRLSMNDTDPSP